MLMVEPQDTDKCDCEHMIKSHKVTKAPKTIHDMPKIKCRYCNCKRIEL